MLFTKEIAMNAMIMNEIKLKIKLISLSRKLK